MKNSKVCIQDNFSNRPIGLLKAYRKLFKERFLCDNKTYITGLILSDPDVLVLKQWVKFTDLQSCIR